MPEFAANLTFLFTELPLLQRFAAAKRAGFTGVELLFPYDLAVKDLSRAARTNGLQFVLMNAPPPNWTGGPRGFAADPQQVERFRRDFDRALRVAEALEAQHIHVMSGIAEGPEAQETFIDNLIWATAQAPGASLTIEPQNQRDMPGYFLSDFDKAAQIIKAVGAPNLGLQFDIYHAHRLTGDVMDCWAKHHPLVRHVQIAGLPDRSEPGGQGCDLRAFLDRIIADGYDGWIGAEYTPAAGTEDGLGWMAVE